MIANSNLVIGNIAGRVFEDINYGGGDGRNYTTANISAQSSGWSNGDIVLGNVRVELYDNSGNFISATTTNATGQYTFSALADGTYHVRVVNNTIDSNRGSNSTGQTIIPVQTFRMNGTTAVVNEVGGADPSLVDANANTINANLSTLTTVTTAAQSVTQITIAGANISNIDFGYNFDVIVNTNNNGQGSLHQFILNSNELVNTNLDQEDTPTNGVSFPKDSEWETSIFMIPGGGFHTITPNTSFPVVTDPFVHLSGYTQQGSVQSDNSNRDIRIQIEGNTTGFDCFRLATDNIIISGYSIFEFRRAIYSYDSGSSNVHFWGNYIGMLGDGSLPSSQLTYGIHINQSAGAIIGTDGDGVNDANEGNIIGSTNIGIYHHASSGLLMSGNWIGLTQDGNSENIISNRAINIHNASGANIIGYDDDLTQSDPNILRNVIASGHTSGLRLQNSSDTKISGNYIGTNISGTASIPCGIGVEMIEPCTNNLVGTDADGDSDVHERNIISGNGITPGLAGGIWIRYTGASTNNVIAGNYVGTDVTGNIALGNMDFGIRSDRFNDFTKIGTNGDGINDATERNIVSGNNGDGIIIVDHDNSIVAGNYVGVGADGLTALGNNGEGIRVAGTGTENIGVGCSQTFTNTNANEIGNIIRNNTGTGLHVTTGVRDNNCLRNNRFGNNGELAIDIGSKGVRVNDNGDGDNGPNDYYNMPIIESSEISGSILTIIGFARPGAILDFYISDGGINPNPLPSGYTTSFGEGRTILGALIEGSVDDLDATTGSYVDDGTGNTTTKTTNRFQFEINISGRNITENNNITAIATQPGAIWNTSEFSGVTRVFIEEICNNGQDDDGDGLTDYLDPECSCCESKAPTLLQIRKD